MKPVGRRPKPSALKIAEGNPGKRPINKNEPKPGGVPTCPTQLDKKARAEWKRVSRELESLGLLTSVDRAAFAAYCAAWSRWISAEENIQKFGTVIKSPKSGYPVQNPYVGVANTALDQMRKFLIEFGMTPASRSRLGTGAPTEMADPFEEFMRGMGAADDVDNDEERTEQSSPIH